MSRMLPYTSARLVALTIWLAGTTAHADPGTLDRVEQGVTSFEGPRIHVDGEPFFPFGLYWFDAEDVETYRHHRINIVYAEGRAAQLQAAVSANLCVFAIGPREMDRLRSYAAEPRLIAWFLMDDAASEEDAKICRERAAHIRSVDDRRPIFASINGRDPAIDARFRDIVDIYCPYRYALPRFSYEEYAGWLDELRRGFGVETYWTTIQSSDIYSRHRQMGFTDLDLARALEPAQLRLLVWTVISHGARGVLMWPERGLFDGRAWTADRRAEVGILGSEIDVLTPLLIDGVENPGGATTSQVDVHACRVDHADANLVILTKLGEQYHLAVDEALARDVEVRIHGAAGARAWTVSFPEPVELEARDSGPDLVVTLDVEVTELLVVTRDPHALEPIAARMASHLPDVATFAVASARAFAAKVGDVLEKLQRLNALPRALTPLPERVIVAIEGKDTELPIDGRHAKERYLSARARTRVLREAGARARAYADLFVEFAPPEASIHRMTVVTLPQFFSSFDVAEAVRRVAGGDPTR